MRQFETGATRNADFFLDSARQKMQERAAQRDVPYERSMTRTVALFHALYGFDLTDEHGWAFMLLLKLVRATTGPYDEDSLIDAVAYCALVAEAKSEDEKAGREVVDAIERTMTTTE